MRKSGAMAIGFCLLASCYSKIKLKTSEVGRVGSLTLEFLPAAGDASDGYINSLEQNGADPLWSLSLPEGTRVEFTDTLNPSATCNESQVYERATILAARDLPQVDGSYMICAKFTDLLNVVTYRKSQTVVRDVVPPTVDVGADILTNVNQALDASTSEAVAWEWRKKSGEGSVTFDAASAEDCNVQADTDGSYVLQLTAWDAAGNSASDELTFSWDTTPPTIGNSVLVASSVTTDSMILSWTKATDNFTPRAELRYQVYHKGHPAFATLSQVKSGHAVAEAVADVSAAYVTDLVDNATYYVNVVVTDNAGNEAVYSKVRIKTAATTTTTFKSIAVGGNHVCGLTPQGQVYCWGNDVEGELGNGGAITANQDTPSAIASAASFVQVTSGTFHSCGLTAAGAAYCWGFNTQYQVGDGNTATRVSPVAVSGGLKFRMLEAGHRHTCGLAETGVIYCWGLDTDGQMGNGDGVTNHTTPAAITSSEKFISVDSGVSRSCGVTDSHQVLCWGNNQYGEIGNGLETGDVHTPTAINSAEKFRSVSLGSWHTCALTLDGRAFCWGRGEDNRLGTGSLANQLSPVAVNTTLRFRSLVAGSAHTCGITSEGKGYCWGLNTSGQLGAGSAAATEPLPVPVASTRTVKQISTIDGTTCMVTTQGDAWCWGSDLSGQLGNGSATTSTQNSPVLVDMTNVAGSAKVFTQLVTGGAFSCGLTSKGYATCWGDNDHGQVGSNGALTTDFATPQELETDRRFTMLAAAVDHACGLTGEGKAYCWGRNTNGQLGTGSTLAQSVPTAVATQESFITLSAGGHTTCGVTIKGTVHCWGSGASGELGNGAASGDQLTPGLVDASGLFRSVAVGASHACAIHSSGQAYCWGANSSGQLGDGTTTMRSSPVLSNAATRFTVVAAGSGFTCALKATGEGVCWGSDDHGRLGNDAVVGDQLTASAVSPAGVFKTLSAGQDHACAINHAGVPYCWGDDSSGQVGNDGTFDASTVAVAPVTTAGNVYIQIAAGGSHTCGLTATGDAFCWGSDVSEQLGDGAGATNLAAPGASAIVL